jgi:predicted RNA-binding protein YlxR (DUF448 family)
MTAAAPAAQDIAELDSGPRGRERERLCVATRTVRPIADLIRFVVGPDGVTTPDLKSKLPGRGVWVTATHGVLGDAIKRKVFARGFKRDVRLPADLLERTERLLEQAALDALAMAGKASLAVTGFVRVETALTSDAVVALIHAADAAADGVRKLDAALHRRPLTAPVAVIGSLTSAQLDLALGRPNVVHAALLAGPSSDTFLARLRRLEGFRTGEPGHQPAAGVPNRADTAAYGTG